jgi:capsular polysaccharide biosynthesis protein
VEETLSLKEIMNTIKKRLLLIIGLTMIATSLTATINFYILTPIYKAQTQILLNPKDSSDGIYSRSQIETDLHLISTYNDIITSPIILSKVVEELQLNTAPESLANKIILSNKNGSKVLYMTVRDSDPEQAVKIANMTAEVFQKEVPKLLNVDNINILSEATYSDRPISPDIESNIVMGAVFGFLLGIGLTFLLEILNTSIKGEKDVEELGLPIMGLVGSIPLEKEKKASLKSRRVRGIQDVWIKE